MADIHSVFKEGLPTQISLKFRPICKNLRPVEIFPLYKNISGNRCMKAVYNLNTAGEIIWKWNCLKTNGKSDPIDLIIIKLNVMWGSKKQTGKPVKKWIEFLKEDF